MVSPVVIDINLKGNHNRKYGSFYGWGVVTDINLKGNHNAYLCSACPSQVVTDINFKRIQCQGDNFLLGFFVF